MTLNPRTIRGTNYVPCEARAVCNSYLYINYPHGTFDWPIVQAEIALLGDSGCKDVRLFQSYSGWVIDKAQHEINLARTVAEFAKYGIRVMLTFLEGVVAAPSVQADTRLELWYDLLGASGTRSWNPLAETNPNLSNPSKTGLLDLRITNDLIPAASVQLHPRLKLGRWEATPGSVYAGLFAYPDNPTDYGSLDPVMQTPDHLAYIVSLAEYIRRTGIAARQGAQSEGFDIGSFDLFNEPDIAQLFSSAAIWGGYPLTQAEFGNLTASSVIGKRLSPVFGLFAYEEARKRYQSIQRWAMNVARLNFPDVPLTMGETRVQALLEYLAAPEGTVVPSFGSVHNYGLGYLVYREELTTVRSSVRGTNGSNSQLLNDILKSRVPSDFEVVYTEFSRHDVREDDSDFYMRGLQEQNMGGIAWGFYRTNGFGSSPATDKPSDWAPSSPPSVPSYNLWPNTGQVHSTVNPDTGGHEIIRPRLRREALWSSWFRSETIEEPRIWTIRPLPGFQFEVVDQDGNSPDPALYPRVVWKWKILDEVTTLDGKTYDPLDGLTYRASDDFTYFPGLRMLASPFSAVLPPDGRFNQEVVHVTQEQVTAGKVILFSVFLGTHEWDPDVAFFSPEQEFSYSEAFVFSSESYEQAIQEVEEDSAGSPIAELLRSYIAEAQQFYPVAYDGDRLPVLDSPVKPVSVYVSEISGGPSHADLDSRDLRQRMPTWRFEARVSFDRRVATSYFEDRVTERPVIVPGSILGPDGKNIVLRLAQGQWELPPTWEGTPNTLIRYVFEGS